MQPAVKNKVIRMQSVGVCIHPLFGGRGGGKMCSITRENVPIMRVHVCVLKIRLCMCMQPLLGVCAQLVFMNVCVGRVGVHTCTTCIHD